MAGASSGRPGRVRGCREAAARAIATTSSFPYDALWAGPESPRDEQVRPHDDTSPPGQTPRSSSAAGCSSSSTRCTCTRAEHAPQLRASRWPARIALGGKHSDGLHERVDLASPPERGGLSNVELARRTGALTSPCPNTRRSAGA